MSENDLYKYITTIKEASIDNHDKNNSYYITQSDLEVVNFDYVKDNYTKELNIKKPPRSNDALFKDESSGEYYFIEFKAGGIDPMKNVEIKFKIYDSLLILLDIIDKTISFSREKMHYILVYDENKKHKSRHYEMPFKIESKRYIQKHVSSKGNTEFVRFDLQKYKNLYFKNVHTYSFEEFETNFISRFDTESR